MKNVSIMDYVLIMHYVSYQTIFIRKSFGMIHKLGLCDWDQVAV